MNILTEAITDLYATVYVTDRTRVHGAARLRAEAVGICDTGRAGGRVRGAPYWHEVHALLRQSYRSLRMAVANRDPLEQAGTVTDAPTGRPTKPMSGLRAAFTRNRPG